MYNLLISDEENFYFKESVESNVIILDSVLSIEEALKNFIDEEKFQFNNIIYFFILINKSYWI
jgi:hypothetical protein